METARAIHLHAGLPKFVWGDCILIATYLINRMQLSIIDWKIPYEMAFQTSPKYEHLRLVSCQCFIPRVGSGFDKFDAKGLKCVFLGYVNNQKGYKVYALDDKKVHVNRDVVFQEDIFSFKHKIDACTLVFPFVQQPCVDSSSDFPSLPASSVLIPTVSSSHDTSHDTSVIFSELPILASSNPLASSSLVVFVRRSTKIKQPHLWLKDYVHSLNNASTIVSTIATSIQKLLFPLNPLFHIHMIIYVH